MPGSSGPTSGSAPLRLRVVASSVEGLVGREFPIERTPMVLGRADDCDLAIPAASVSRRHARIESEGGTLWVRDAGSANGLVIDGGRVDQAPLAAGLRFALGDTHFEVVAEAPPPAPAAAAAEEAPAVERTARIENLGEIVARFEGRGAAPAAVPPAAAAGEVAASASAPAELPPVDRTAAIANFAEIVKQLEQPGALEELGERLVSAANKPFLLDDPEVAWIVESGKVEIFTVAVERGEPAGAREHFLTVVEGQAFFGFDTERYGMGSGFLVVGKAGSVLRRFDLARLMDLAMVPAHAARIGKLLGTWIEGLSRRLTVDLPSLPTTDLRLEAGTEAKWSLGQKVSPGNDVLWIELPAERLLFDGMASLGRDLEGVFFPLGPTCWLELLSAEEPLEVLPRRSADAAGDPRLWAGLDVFHRVLCECEFVNKKLAYVDEFQRLQKKAEQVEKAQESAYAAIGSVLGGTGIWLRPSALGVDAGPILKAAALVADSLGLQVRPHPDAREDLNFEDTVTAIAAASRFRVRRVALVDDWWNRDQGPFLGRRAESNVPVAILPTGPRSYVLVDPISGERAAIDEEVARGVEPFAWTFYRPFPAGALKAIDLAKFGARGLGSELRTVALMGGGVGLLSTLTPMISGKVFDVAIPQAERGLLWQFALGLALAALTSAAFKITQNVALMRVQGKMDYSIQSAVWDRLIDLPMDFFRKFSSGDLADRAAGVNQIRSIISGAGVGAILGSISSTFNAVQMLTYSGPLALVAIGMTILYVLVSWLVNYLQLRYQRREYSLRGRISGLVLQLIGGVAKLRVAGAEDHAFKMWALRFAEQRKVSFKIGGIQNTHQIFTAGFPIVSNMAIFFTMYMLKQGALERGEKFDLTTGDFLAFSAAFGLFTSAMQALGDASLSMLRIVPVFERLQPILTTEPEVDPSKTYPGQLKGEIELSHLWFRYAEDSPWIVKDLSLKIKPGEMVAFVGGSGCGKSTLLRLMLGFERPQKGSVYFDGQDLATLDLRMVRQQLGVVLQDSRLLPADIYRNIVGTSSRTLEDAWAAAQKASIADDIRAMPMGMHTVVSEGGGAFSGGQKQRLMIARALVNNPRIIFLDEATSALDNRAQAIVTESMNRLQATRIVIAHRLSTIVDADKICYLEAGQVMEQGSYAELMALDGKFAALAKRQLA